MAIAIQNSSKFKPRPRFLLYSQPGGGKTTLAATCGEQGKGEIMFGFTEGGVQSISHLNAPYVDILNMAHLEDVIAMFKAGKKNPEEGIITVGNKDFRGFVLDLLGEFVETTLSEMCGQAEERIKNKGLQQVLDDPSMYEYKKLNMRIGRKMRELTALPLRYVGFTSYAEEITDKESGALIEVRPKFVGGQIWTNVTGHVDYVFHLTSPANPADSQKFRNIRTQKQGAYYAKARVPAVSGNHPLPVSLKYPLGHPDFLQKVFGKVEEYIVGARKLEPIGDVPSDVTEGEAVTT